MRPTRNSHRAKWCVTRSPSIAPPAGLAAMLLIEALDIDQETLTDTATWYDLETTVAAMYQALQEGSKTRTRSLSSFQVNQNLWRSKSSTV